MKHHLFAESNAYPIAVLIKHTSFNKQEIVNNYLDPLAERGISSSEVIAFTLDYNETGKAPASFVKDYLAKLLPALDSLGTKYLYAADSTYFKVLVGQTKAEPHHGYVLPCKIKGFEHMHVVLGINYQALIYNPDLKDKLDGGLTALVDHVQGTYQAPGTGIIHSAQYPEGTQTIAEALQSLHQYPMLSCDIETRSLKFHEAGIETIAFAWDKHNGVAFRVDRDNTSEASLEIKQLLKEFFTSYIGIVVYHNATFDVQILIYELWMKDI